MYNIGIDIGGMSIKVGLVDDNGKIIEKNKKTTENTAEKCIKNIIEQINSLFDSNKITLKDIRGIGVGCPGAVTGETGIIDILPNLGWENVKLAEEIKKAFPVNVKISNDANVAALAETIYGAGKGAYISVMFTLGTGVGGGVVIDGKLFEGYKSKGAELGHTTLYADGIPCTCGRNGCVERYVSASALIEQTKLEMLKNKQSKLWKYVSGNIDNVKCEYVFECSKLGDKSAQFVIDNYVKYLSESMMNMFNIFRPDVFILGGGVSGAGDYLIEKCIKYMEKFDYGYKGAPIPKVVIATLGNDAGIIGAAALLN